MVDVHGVTTPSGVSKYMLSLPGGTEGDADTVDVRVFDGPQFCALCECIGTIYLISAEPPANGLVADSRCRDGETVARYSGRFAAGRPG